MVGEVVLLTSVVMVVCGRHGEGAGVWVLWCCRGYAGVGGVVSQGAGQLHVLAGGKLCLVVCGRVCVKGDRRHPPARSPARPPCPSRRPPTDSGAQGATHATWSCTRPLCHGLATEGVQTTCPGPGR